MAQSGPEQADGSELQQHVICRTNREPRNCEEEFILSAASTPFDAQSSPARVQASHQWVLSQYPQGANLRPGELSNKPMIT